MTTNNQKNNSNKKETNSVEQNLNTDYVPKNKLGDLPMTNGIDPQIQKAMDKTQKDLEKYKKEIIKKYKYIEAIGIIPAQAAKKIEEEYEVPESEAKKGLIHVITIIPEDHFKDIGKVRLDAIKVAKEANEKLWVHVMTPVDVWNLALDSKQDIVEAFGMSYPILDKGLLGSLRVAQIHKTLVLKKFEKYVTTYGIYGSLTRGDANETSDVDVAIIIDDTDVKRMSRTELREKLRGIVYGYIQEATAIAGVKNILNVQVWLLTEFWDGVKDANPIFFTFIRDGVPIYDRGTFLPWKSLLRLGKIKPSPEAIDMFMSTGDKVEEIVNRRLMDIVMIDIYWSVIQPTQGLLMLYGLAPPTLQETMKLVREELYKKEKLIEKKYVDILEEVLIKYYKGYEHGKIKKVTGTEIDKLLKDVVEYNNRLKELRFEIEKRVQEKSIEQIYKDVFKMLEALLKKKSESSIINEFEDSLIKQGKFPHRFIEQLKFIAKTRKELLKKTNKSSKKQTTKKKGKQSKKDELKEIGKQTRDVDKARKFAAEITNALIEYTQRCDFMEMDRTRYIIKSKNNEKEKEITAEIFFLEDTFIIEAGRIQKFKNNMLHPSNQEELRSQLDNQRGKQNKIDFNTLKELKKIYGDFELVY